MLISSSLIYYAEHDAQLDIYSSIPGKINATFTAIFGIGLFALPGGIIASALMETAKTPAKICPYCGK